MVELISAIQDPMAQVTLAVLVLAVVLFISGAIAPELTGLLSVGLLNRMTRHATVEVDNFASLHGRWG